MAKKKTTVVKQTPRPSYFAGNPRPQVKLAPKQEAQPSKQLPVPKLGAITGGKPTVRPSTTFVPKLGAITGGRPTISYAPPHDVQSLQRLKPPPAPTKVNPGGGIKTGTGPVFKQGLSYNITTTPTTSPTGVTRLATGRLSGNPTPGAPTGATTGMPPPDGYQQPYPGAPPSGVGYDPRYDLVNAGPPGTPSSSTPSLDDLFQHEVSSARGGIDDAEKSAAAAMASFNKSILDSNLGGLLGSKAYASMISNILQDQAKQMTSYADQRAKLAASLPSEYNKLQSQLADQAAVNARLDFDYFKENASQQQFGAEFGLKQQQFGFDQAKFGAEFGLKQQQFGLDVASKKADVANKNRTYRLDVAKLKTTVQGKNADRALKTYQTNMSILEKEKDRALKAGALKVAQTIAKQQADLNTWYKQQVTGIAKQRNVIAANRVIVSNKQADTARARLAEQTANDIYNNKIAWARVKATDRATSVRLLASDRTFAAAMARIGVQKQANRIRAATALLKARSGGYTPAKIHEFKVNAYDTALDFAHGFPGVKAIGGGWKVKPVKKTDYNTAINNLVMQYDIPYNIAVEAANKIWAPGQGGRPVTGDPFGGRG